MRELYSRRIRNLQGEPEVYQYDVFPETFRNQVFYILSDAFRFCQIHGKREIWKNLHDSFSRELGVKMLYKSYTQPEQKIEGYLLVAGDQEFLDFLDYAFHGLFMIKVEHMLPCSDEDISRVINQSIDELNYRLQQHSLGYEFVNGEIIRKDSEYLHQEVVKPALKLLIDADFQGAEQEFMNAFEHRRKGENKEAIQEALKAFESTMKAICEKLGYPYDNDRNTAKELISILEGNGFYPAYLNAHITSIRASLESGLPTMRNRNAGHGQGADVTPVSDEFTEYALNLSATNILLLTRIYLSKKREVAADAD